MIPLALSPKECIDAEIAELERLSRDARSQGLIAEADLTWFCAKVKKYKSDLASLLRSSKLGDDKACRTKVERLLHSGAAKIVAVARIAIRGKYENLPSFGLSQNVLEARIKTFDFYKPLNGFAQIHEVQSGSGKSRPTLNFSGNIRAAQLVITDILLAMQLRSSIDYNNPGKGHARAVRQICRMIELGFSEWLSFDLKNYYPSINRNHLDWLPLPNEVILSCVFPNAYLCISGKEEVKKAVRQGLPLGAALSGIIASAMIERELQSVIEGDCWVGSCVDDVAIGACSPAGLSIVADAIESRFNKHPAGPLPFKFFKKSQASEGVGFVGYDIRDFGADGQHDVRAWPNGVSRKRFQLRLFDKLDKEQLLDFDERASFSVKYAERWLSSFFAMPLDASLIEDVKIEAEIMASEWGTISQIKHYPILNQI